MKKTDELNELLNQYAKTFQSLTEIETKKITAAKTYNLEDLDACMKQEQVIILQIRGYEQKREKLQEELSLTGKKLNELLSLLPEEDQSNFSTSLDNLKNAYDEFRPVYDRATEILTINAHRIEVIINNMQSHAKAGSAYSPQGEIKSKNAHSFTNLKI